MNQPRQLDPGSIKRGRLTRLLVAKLGISVNLCIAYYYQQQQQEHPVKCGFYSIFCKLDKHFTECPRPEKFIVIPYYSSLASKVITS
jgi:hypothetical protein